MTFNDVAADINKIAVDHGFWPAEGRNMGEMIALMHSELSEALEEHRAGRPSIWFAHKDGCPKGTGFNRDAYKLPPCECHDPKPEGVAVELADCIIRALDTMYSLGVDIDAVISNKMNYNRTRPYKHGKTY